MQFNWVNKKSGKWFGLLAIGLICLHYQLNIGQKHQQVDTRTTTALFFSIGFHKLCNDNIQFNQYHNKLQQKQQQ